MAESNPVFDRLNAILKPIFPIGSGSAIFTVCSKNGFSVSNLSAADVPVLKPLLIEHYRKYYEHKVAELEQAFSRI